LRDLAIETREMYSTIYLRKPPSVGEFAEGAWPQWFARTEPAEYVASMQQDLGIDSRRKSGSSKIICVFS
jgi:hypothetical protein